MKTRFNPVILVLSLALIIVLSNACKKDEGNNTYGNDEIRIAENVLILNGDQSGQLIEVSDTELTFSEGDEDIGGIEEGDIVVSDIIEGLAPKGFLRRVLTITESSGQVILTTEDAQLTDAIESCSVRFEKELTDDDIGGKTSSFDFNLKLSENSPIEGELRLEPRILFELDIAFFSVEYAKLGIGINQIMSVKLETLAGVQYQLEKELFEKDLKPITILIGGIFPLIITPDFELEAGFSYQGPTLYTKYSVSGLTEYYVEKDDNGWDAHQDTKENAVTSGISGSLETSFEVYIEPSIEFEFYDIDNVETSFYAQKYVRGEAKIDTEEGIGCEFKCGIRVGGEVEVKVLGFELNPSIEAEIAEFPPFYECSTNGLSDDVNDLIPDSLLTVLEDLDMPINEGFDPPNIEGRFSMTPLILKSSNIPEDEIGRSFSDLELEFFDQNPQDLTIQVKSTQGDASGAATGSFIVGQGNDFSVFVELNISDSQGSNRKLGIVYSGSITSGGIIDFHCAHLMLNDYGDPNDDLIAIGQARVAIDSDGFSPRQ